MDIAVGDTILTRKQHPCGAASFEVLRVGMDFKIRCTGCGREGMLPRAKIEKNIKKVIKWRPSAAGSKNFLSVSTSPKLPPTRRSSAA